MSGTRSERSCSRCLTDGVNCEMVSTCTCFPLQEICIEVLKGLFLLVLNTVHTTSVSGLSFIFNLSFKFTVVESSFSKYLFLEYYLKLLPLSGGCSQKELFTETFPLTISRT